MNGRFSNYQITTWMDQVSAKTLWIALFTSDPYTVLNPLTAELLGASIVRQPSSWSRTTDYSIELENDVTFRAIPPETTIVSIGAFDAQVNGNLIFRDLLSENGKAKPLYFGTGGTLTVPAGQFVAGIDIPT